MHTLIKDARVEVIYRYCVNIISLGTRTPSVATDGLFRSHVKVLWWCGVCVCGSGSYVEVSCGSYMVDLCMCNSAAKVA